MGVGAFLLGKAAMLAARVALPLDMPTLRMRGVLRLRDVSTDDVEARWLRAEAAKAVMPKDPTWQHMTPEQLRDALPVRVISLTRAKERREVIVNQLERAGLSYEVFDAVDGRNTSLPDSEVARFVRGVRLGLWRKGHAFHRGKVAIDLSHLINLERIVRENRSAVLIEDDAGIPSGTPNWYARLLAALRELPQDWDMLYLNACFTTVGKRIGERIAVLRGGACTLGYAITPKHARAVLASVSSASRKGLTPFIDLLYQDLMQHGEANAYICTPPLLDYADQSRQSTIDYGSGAAGLSKWERWWLS
ncbi:glycosyltransferase 25 family member [Scenedesmus sp. PABB004]|nr:glycosyltransferase 25 family member [Scenedesmus sp. PABB004]